MPYAGSFASGIWRRCQAALDVLEDRAPWADKAALFIGLAIGLLGFCATYYHNKYPGSALTEAMIGKLGDAIRHVHSLLPWSVADTATYLGPLVAGISLVVILVRWLYNHGGTKTFPRGSD